MMPEPFVNEDVGRRLICDPSLDLHVRAEGYHDSRDFEVERLPGRIVWRTFDMHPSERLELDRVCLFLGLEPLSCCMFRRAVQLYPGDSLHLTYTLEWWYRGGGGCLPPRRSLGLRPKTSVPPLSRFSDICFSLSV